MEREARRRRRIVDTSSDRLALITGRLQNLEIRSPPLTPISPNPDNDYLHVTTRQSAPPGWVNANIDDQEHEHEHHRPPPQQPHLAMKESMQASVGTHKNGEESSAVDTRILSTKALSEDADMFLKPGGRTLLSCFTAKEINYCIVSSEDTRVFCSIMIALLVVIAYANLPRHIVKSKSLIASRPLYVLLLTDVMIVILRVTYVKHKDSGSGVDMKLKQAMKLQEGDSNNWDGAIKLLEWGLVLYQSVRAVFIDCSFYIVIVICGFAFM